MPVDVSPVDRLPGAAGRWASPEAAEGGVVELRGIGDSDVQLSVVGLGGAWLGDDPENRGDVSKAGEVVQAAAEAGMNWLDTSENYFDSRNEAVIGAILARHLAPFLVCTKLAPGAAASGGGSGF